MDPTKIKTLDELSLLDSGQLDQLYAASPAGEIPDGDSNGRALFMPGSLPGKILSLIGNLIWKGKVFDRANGRLMNKMLGTRAVAAEVYLGESWSDGKPAVIVDYQKTSRLASFIRDEIRQLEPGLYLGKAY